MMFFHYTMLQFILPYVATSLSFGHNMRNLDGGIFACLLPLIPSRRAEDFQRSNLFPLYNHRVWIDA